MTLTHGADADRLRDIAAQLDDQSTRMTRVGTEASARLVVLRGAWEGPDLEDFDREWRVAQRQVEECAARLGAAARHLTAQADEQGETSAQLGGGAGGPAGPPTSPGPSAPGPQAPPSPPPPGGSSFDDDVRGTEGQRVDRDLWSLAHHVYGSDNALYDDPLMHDGQPGLPPGYTMPTEDEIRALGLDPAQFTDDSSGLQSSLYRTPDGGYVLAFRGSDADELSDWVDNGLQGAGLPARQYTQAMELAAQVNAATGGDVTFTGHSLGGGLAAAAAMATGQPAVTFDAAGVHEHTAEAAAALRADGSTGASVMAETSEGQIRAYSTSTDILTTQQQSGPLAGLLPDAPGTQIVLETPPSERGDAAARTGAIIGSVVGAVTSGFDLNPFDTARDIAEGAQTGADIGTGVWGHHWDPMEEALAERYPD